VPAVRGETDSEARRLLTEAGFTKIEVIVSDVPDPRVDPDTAQGTDPPGGSMQPLDETVTIIMNRPA
jgi:beta-lactam-binding protein with PASTA domain